MAMKQILAAGIWASLAVLPADAYADTLSSKVIAVADGDTLTLLEDQQMVHVRIAGIDAPEKGQPFGQASKQGLSKCAFGNQVEVEWHKRDLYGRTVGKVMAGTVDCGHPAMCGAIRLNDAIGKGYKPAVIDEDRFRHLHFALTVRTSGNS